MNKPFSFLEKTRLSFVIALLLLAYTAPAFGQKIEAVSHMKKVMMGHLDGLSLGGSVLILLPKITASLSIQP